MSSHDSAVAPDDVPLTPGHAAEHTMGIESTPTQTDKKGKSLKQHRLTENQKEQVLDFLKRNPFLFDKRQDGYKDPALKHKTWTEFAATLGLSYADVTGWVKSMRSLFSRAKKNIRKSGSGLVNLQPAEKWAWDNFAFMSSSVTELSQDILGLGEGEAVHDSSEPEDLEEPAPRRKRSRHSGTATTDSGTGCPRRVLPGSHQSDRSSSENPTHAGRVGQCCESLCAQMESMFQRFATPNAHFWGAIDWRMRNVSSKGFHEFQSRVWKLADEIIEAEGDQGLSNNQIPDVPGHAGGLPLHGAASKFPSMSAVLQQAVPADDDPLNFLIVQDKSSGSCLSQKQPHCYFQGPQHSSNSDSLTVQQQQASDLAINGQNHNSEPTSSQHSMVTRSASNVNRQFPISKRPKEINMEAENIKGEFKSGATFDISVCNQENTEVDEFLKKGTEQMHEEIQEFMLSQPGFVHTDVASAAGSSALPVDIRMDLRQGDSFGRLCLGDQEGLAVNFTSQRERFTFRKQHLEILETCFKTNQYPSYKERCDIAQRCNDAMEAALSIASPGRGLGEKERMTAQNIAYWFSNRRRDIKRMAREGGFELADVILPSKVKQAAVSFNKLDTNVAHIATCQVETPVSSYSPLEIPSAGPVAFPTMVQRTFSDTNSGTDTSRTSPDGQIATFIVKMEVTDNEPFAVAAPSNGPGSLVETEISSQLLSKSSEAASSTGMSSCLQDSDSVDPDKTAEVKYEIEFSQNIDIKSEAEMSN